jgi:hypothetical protein
MIAARLLDRSVFPREMLPQDLNLEINQPTRPVSIEGRALSGIRRGHRAWAPDGCADPAQISGRGQPERLERSGCAVLGMVEHRWLGRSHEAAYLEHCRGYALETAA